MSLLGGRGRAAGGRGAPGVAQRPTGARVVSRSGRSRPRPGTPSTDETLDAARARAAAPPLPPSIVADPNPAAPRAAAAPHRSSAEPSPHTPPGNPRGSVISNWHTGDILIGRLHLIILLTPTLHQPTFAEF